MSDIRKTAGMAVILAIGMIVSAAFLSKLFVRIKHEKEITVKGYAEQSVVSDVGKFYCSYSIRGKTLKDAYEGLQKIRSLVLKYLKDKGFEDGEMEIFNIQTSEIYKKNEKGNDTNEIELYKVSQGIGVTSGDVHLVKETSQGITELIKEGIDIYCNPPDFYVSDIKTVKLELIARATKDGYERTQILARNSHGKVGRLSSAQQGVFQITSPNSTETSGYGIYDTSTIEKTAKAVVTLEYTIE